MSAAPIIRAEGLSKRFGDFTAVDRLSFTVASGSIFAFLGANGSGKSTTIRMLIGLLRPTAGTIAVDGIDVVRSPRRVRDHVGYMGQRVSLYDTLTLRENLEFYAGLYDIGGATLERRWGALSERLALREAEGERAGELPAGVRQRAGLALSTLHRPRVLFLDEPTAGVDVQNRLLFWDLIQDEADAGVTVFVTTHFLEEVDYCDWVCFIDAGRAIANGEPEAIRRRYSDGYRVRLDLADPAARREAVAALAPLAHAVTATAEGVALHAPALTPALVAALAARSPPAGPGRLHVEQPDMNGIFRRLMRDVAAGDEAPAAASAPADDAVAAAPPAAAAPVAARRPWRTRGRRLWTLMLREARATLRDRSTVVMLTTVPLAALLTFGSIISTEVNDLPLAVLDASGTTASRQLVADLRATGAFAPRRVATRAALERALVSNAVSVALVIPPDFDRARPRDPAEIQVLYDGAEPVLAANAEASLRGVLAAAGARGRPDGDDGRYGAAPRTRVVTRALFNPDLDGVPFMVAGTYGFVLTFLTTLITAVAIVNERITGTFEQLQVTPATAGEIVLGKILPLGAVFALDVVLMLVLAGLWFGVWPHGSVALFVAVSAFYVLVSLAAGLLVSATSATAAEAVQKTVLLSIPLIFLGGFLFPIRSMPAPFRWIAELFPATHYIRISRAVYLRGEGLLALLPEIAMVALIGAVLMAFAFRSLEARA